MPVIEYTIEKNILSMEPGAEFKVSQCHVIDGYKFKMLLENGEWIIAHIPNATKADATQSVVDILKNSEIPSVVLRRKLSGYWIVDFHLTIQGKHTTLRNQLREIDSLL